MMKVQREPHFDLRGGSNQYEVIWYGHEATVLVRFSGEGAEQAALRLSNQLDNALYNAIAHAETKKIEVEILE